MVSIRYRGRVAEVAALGARGVAQVESLLGVLGFGHGLGARDVFEAWIRRQGERR
jgi:hypothetical protein